MIVLDLKKLCRGRVLQVLAITTGSLALVSDGMQMAWSSPMIPYLKSPSSPIAIQDSDIVWIENFYNIGGLVGPLLTIFMFDKVGRKRSIIIFSTISLIGWMLIAFASSTGLLFAARFIFGLTGYGAFIGLSIYTSEISDKTIRGRLQTLSVILTILGTVSMYSIGPFVSITISSVIGALTVIFHLLTFSFMPESPYYFLIHNEKVAAEKSLQKFRSTSCNIEDELNEIVEAVEKQNTERGRPLDLLTVKSNRNATIIITIFTFLFVYSGSIVIMMNTHMILQDAPVILSSNVVAILYSIFLLIACIVSFFVIDAVGRKLLLSTSSFLSGFSLLFLACYFAAEDQGLDVESWNWIPVFALILFAITNQCGLATVPIIILSEIYPTNVKAIGNFVSAIIYGISSISSIYLFNFLQHNYGMYAPFFLFGACCTLSGLFTIFCVPETKGISLEEIQRLLKGEDKINNANDNSQVNYGSNE